MTWVILLPAAISISKVTCSASSQLGQEGIADSQCFKKRLREGECVGVRGRWSHGIHYSSYEALQWMASGSLCHCLELCKIPQWNSSVTQSRWPSRAEVGGYAQFSCATAAGQWLGPKWTAFVALFSAGTKQCGVGLSSGLQHCASTDLLSAVPVQYAEWVQPLWCLLDAMGIFIAAIVQRDCGMKVDLGSAVVKNPFLLSFLAQPLTEWRAPKIPSHFRSIMFPKLLNFPS